MKTRTISVKGNEATLIFMEQSHSFTLHALTAAELKVC